LYWVIQENSIEIPLQTNLPYILLTMVCVHYCAPYPKQPCVEHEVNMCYPCCMMSFVLEPSTLFSQISWSMLWSHHQIVTNVTVCPITSNPNPSCSKNRKLKNENKRKRKIKLKTEKWSLLSMILTIKPIEFTISTLPSLCTKLWPLLPLR